MELPITSAILMGPPDIAKPSENFISALGEEGIRQLINDHYDLLVESSISHMFPKQGKGLEMAKERSADFFIQICGGHPHYVEKRGNPMMRKRHMPFQISDKDRIVWLECYQTLLPKLDLPYEVVRSFWDFLNIFSQWMVTKYPNDYNVAQ